MQHSCPAVSLILLSPLFLSPLPGFCKPVCFRGFECSISCLVQFRSAGHSWALAFFGSEQRRSSEGDFANQRPLAGHNRIKLRQQIIQWPSAMDIPSLLFVQYDSPRLCILYRLPLRLACHLT